ncbi:hypothetical protein C488_17416 [Natrinema pellirubrum DSM 15624]|uniref:Uncharacterized protein n=1 Tax=Natrinema pellirubrum (strain DSM 15624 / CIP 106293 / JCM 10476 / NCIMB 786 / 157) TaxID=797303 RepID=L9YBN7_NATP1|nr:hypothetical protein C488_17416 [Natrinema pellirubrum DSM 15624]ELZ11777.1 hypothetical protein C478_11405 [Natrinema thermotolerans DSM 11552]
MPAYYQLSEIRVVLEPTGSRAARSTPVVDPGGPWVGDDGRSGTGYSARKHFSRQPEFDRI